ncbi:hypothetical protein NITHO_1590006 [Nitrolancea hollandica Lb]|uniref:Uncharacterized protein n=1 Tax=Nitrolancea hollandica Lb TaxID=1129897 RepID=I4EDQ3_9BACT|nr:hypothetical protein NITHO_1590006 [Nitrolancea hollandica Lb]
MIDRLIESIANRARVDTNAITEASLAKRKDPR